jgi:HrpA-like RNA helicase
MHTDFRNGSRAMPPALIGRDHPAATLRAEIARAHDSRGLVLVTGEAGIGKTTLVTSAMAQARQLGTLVVGGSRPQRAPFGVRTTLVQPMSRASKCR